MKKVNVGKTRAMVNAFADKHPRFDELAPHVERLLQLGLTLKVAYAIADHLFPVKPAKPRTRRP